MKACRGLALCGIMMCLAGSRSSVRMGGAAARRSPSVTMPCECDVRVVVRNSTGVSKLSLSS